MSGDFCGRTRARRSFSHVQCCEKSISRWIFGLLPLIFGRNGAGNVADRVRLRRLRRPLDAFGAFGASAAPPAPFRRLRRRFFSLFFFFFSFFFLVASMKKVPFFMISVASSLTSLSLTGTATNSCCCWMSGSPAYTRGISYRRVVPAPCVLMRLVCY